MNRNYNQKSLWELILKRIDHDIHVHHVRSIMRILIDEISKELISGSEIKILNFGTLKIQELKPKKIRNIATKKITFTKRVKILRFKLTRRYAKYLSNKSLDDMRNSVEVCEEKQEQ